MYLENKSWIIFYSSYFGENILDRNFLFETSKFHDADILYFPLMISLKKDKGREDELILLKVVMRMFWVYEETQKRKSGC